MIDYNETGAILYPTMVQNAPMAPSVDAKPTSEPATTKATEPRAVDSTTTTHQNPDGPSALALPKDAVIDAKAIERTMAFANTAGLSPEAAQQVLEHANGGSCQ